MIAAFEALAESPRRGRLLAVLGQMGELGALSEESHRRVGPPRRRGLRRGVRRRRRARADPGRVGRRRARGRPAGRRRLGAPKCARGRPRLDQGVAWHATRRGRPGADADLILDLVTFAVTFVIALVLYPPAIRGLRRVKAGQVIQAELPDSHPEGSQALRPPAGGLRRGRDRPPVCSRRWRAIGRDAWQ